MNDSQIIALYFQRSEEAIAETDARYGSYCYSIANNILYNSQDSEECVSDTYLQAWNRIPPTRPRMLSVYLGRITRSLAIDTWRSRHAVKRGRGQMDLAIQELDRTLSSGEDLEEQLMQAELTAQIDGFLRGLPETERQVFVCRYWYMDPVAQIAREFGFTESKTAAMLMRTRKKLKAYLLEKGGYEA